MRLIGHAVGQPTETAPFAAFMTTEEVHLFGANRELPPKIDASLAMAVISVRAHAEIARH